MSISGGEKYLGSAEMYLAGAQTEVELAHAEYAKTDSAVFAIGQHILREVPGLLDKVATNREQAMMSLAGAKVVYESVQQHVEATGLSTLTNRTAKGQALLDTVAQLGGMLDRFFELYGESEQAEIEAFKQAIADCGQKGTALQQALDRRVDSETGTGRVLAEIGRAREAITAYRERVAD